MAKIEVTENSPLSFAVTIHGTHTTSHQVSVNADYAQRLTQGKISVAALIEASFAFLLDRESNTSILRSFDLSVIERYFPEYPRTISQYFA
jgi:hypothetical protein